MIADAKEICGLILKEAINFEQICCAQIRFSLHLIYASKTDYNVQTLLEVKHGVFRQSVRDCEKNIIILSFLKKEMLNWTRISRKSRS